MYDASGEGGYNDGGNAAFPHNAGGMYSPQLQQQQQPFFAGGGAYRPQQPAQFGGASPSSRNLPSPLVVDSNPSEKGETVTGNLRGEEGEDDDDNDADEGGGKGGGFMPTEAEAEAMANEEDRKTWQAEIDKKNSVGRIPNVPKYI